MTWSPPARAATLALLLALPLAGCGGGGAAAAGAAAAPAAPAPAGPTTVSAPVQAGVASFAERRGAYLIGRESDGYTVTNQASRVIATVVGASALRFADITISLDIGAKATALGSDKLKALIELYSAALNRVPEADELGAWIDKLQAGQSMAQLADQLYAAAARSALSGYSDAMTNDVFVKALYKSVFGLSGASAPAPNLVEAWAVRIDKGGISRGALMLAMLAAARSSSPELASASTGAGVVALLDNKILVGRFCAVQQGVSYNAALESDDVTMAVKAAVTATDTSAAIGLITFSDPLFDLSGGK